MATPSPIISKVLSYLTKRDVEYSARVHQLRLGYGDYLLAIPGVACSSHCVPGIIALVFLSTSVPLGTITTIASVLTVLLTESVKKRTRRDRPVHSSIHPRLLNLRSLLTNFSFPSGDSAQAAVLSLSFFLYCQLTQPALPLPVSALWLLLLPVVQFSRVYFGCHWIGDVLMGGGIGALVTAAVWTGWLLLLKLPVVHPASSEFIKRLVS